MIDSCSWCGRLGPFPIIDTGETHQPSAYCTACHAYREAHGAFPPRTAEQREMAVHDAQRRRAARIAS